MIAAFIFTQFYILQFTKSLLNGPWALITTTTTIKIITEDTHKNSNTKDIKEN